MRLETTDTTVVYSINKSGIKLSLRTMAECNVGKIANDALEGIGNGGGHENMAGGFVAYDLFMDNPTENAEYIEGLIKEIKDRILKTISA